MYQLINFLCLFLWGYMVMAPVAVEHAVCINTIIQNKKVEGD